MVNHRGQTDPGDAGSNLLTSAQHMADVAQSVISHARTMGVADILCAVEEMAGGTVRVVNRSLDSAVRDGSYSLSVTIYDRGRTGQAHSQSLAAEDVRRTVDHARAIAAQVEPDEAAGLAAPALMAFDTPDIPLFAPSAMGMDGLEDRALQAEESALETGNGALRVLEAGMASHDRRWALATSQGFLRTGSSSFHQSWCVALAGNDGAMVRDAWQSQDRHFQALLSPEALGALAARRTLDKRNARPVPAWNGPVLIDATVASSLVGELCAALGGRAQHQRATFLPDALGQTVLPDDIDLIEEPLEPFGLASRAYDGEGVAGRTRAIVEGGVVSGLFLSSASARKLGMQSTGSADGYGNLTLSSRQPGGDQRQMLTRLQRGLWLTEFLGGNVNPVTGAYSKAAAGFWVEQGQVAYPVHNLMVSGNIRDILRGVVTIGSDTHRAGAVRTGSILIETLQVTGG
ncbi:metallopeptidase TldD-related protein [Niveispirillum sp. BGYR6]|uniref:TldD/PmbA family protein n=1 Tax=Niveispirillum sp. BGYR6 TaxID=2971249 RepID=UPI0022B97442|nr:metallopeptidase TldD-related protein [Niveispirillum sp. BGYR6]MDG5497535.1 metallopeptidase TldD-related protein [Niveispirillum sp. BGYR6]